MHFLSLPLPANTDQFGFTFNQFWPVLRIETIRKRNNVVHTNYPSITSVCFIDQRMMFESEIRQRHADDLSRVSADEMIITLVQISTEECFV